jgi:1-acyl-sn-glycerol-3-phosphate acyltransferase
MANRSERSLAFRPNRVQRLIYAFARGIVVAVSKMCFGLRSVGAHRVPAEGGALLLGNHASFLDPPVIGAPLRRHLRYMARDTLFRNRLFGWFLHCVNAFPVRRGRPDKDSIRRAVAELASGELLVMFPEGTRSPDGTLQPMKGGFRILVRRAGVPVIPVAVDGSFEAWPRDGTPRPHPVRVAYGRPISAAVIGRLSDEEAAERVRSEILRLLLRLRRLR